LFFSDLKIKDKRIQMIKRGFLLLFMVLLLINVSTIVAGETMFTTNPTTNNGHKWRIAYFEGGPYRDYQEIFSETIRGLMNLGWIEKTELPTPKGDSTEALWRWLAKNAKSNYLEFVEDAYYSADWIKETRSKMVAQVMQRLNQNKDIDLLIAMGTVAGQDFANNQHDTPTLVLSSSDALASGIVKSLEDSGFEHIHATLDPNRYERQVRIFHEVVGFNKLGIFHENSVNGRSYAGVNLVEKVAKERGFEIIRCYVLDESTDSVQAREESVLKCFEELAKKVDAIYVTQQLGVNRNTIPQLISMSHRYHIPTFSQAGSFEVKYGFLLSLSQMSYEHVGKFHAQTMAKVFNGAKPNQLSQVFEEPIKLAINLKTAEIIGFYLDARILAATDEFYYEIRNPE
jgi:ABC-type uncharacterized transport system substrate-binding protein